MTRNKKILIGLGTFLFVVAVIAITLNWYVKGQIKQELDKSMSSYSLEYEDISINVLGGNSSVSHPRFTKGIISFEADDIRLKSISYSDYLFNGNIVFDRLEIDEPKIIINRSDSLENREDNSAKEMERNYTVKKLAVTGGSIQIIENDTAVSSLFIGINSLQVDEVLFNNSTSGGLLPFEYKEAEIKSDSLLYQMNEEHLITVENLMWKDEELSLKHFKIIPKYSIAEFDKIVPYEKDRIELTVKEILLRNFDWAEQKDSLTFTSPEMVIDEADLLIYRNKLLSDDNSIKPMYSEMIRNLGVKIELDSIRVENSKIVYEEKILEERPPAKLGFKNVNATIKNITNLNLDSKNFPETKINAEALFMDKATLTMNWQFNINNTQDEFDISGHLNQITAEAVNPFLKPAMNVEVEGEIVSLFYNFHGNAHAATGDMQLKYRDFKVNILKDGEEGSKSFLSDLANMILKNDSVNEEVSQKNIEVERDRTKSFWNFLWLCIREGAIKTLL